MGSDEARCADDENDEAGVGVVASRASDVVLLVEVATGVERSARVGSRRRREKEKEVEDCLRRKQSRVLNEKNGEQLETREREKKITKILNVSAIVIVHMHGYCSNCAFMHIFTPTDVDFFWVKMCKMKGFLHFTRL